MSHNLTALLTHGAYLDLGEGGEFFAQEVGADKDGIVTARVEDDELVSSRLGRRHDLLDERPLGDRAGRTVHTGVNGGKDVALFRHQTVTSKVDERQVRTGRALLELLESLKKPAAVDVEAARRLAIAGDHLEAVFCEQLHHADRIGHRIIERSQANLGRGPSRVGALPNDQRDTPRLSLRLHQREQNDAGKNAREHDAPRMYQSSSATQPASNRASYSNVCALHM